MVIEASKRIFNVLPVHAFSQRLMAGVFYCAVLLSLVAAVQYMGKAYINTWLIYYDERPLMTAGIWEAEYFLYVVGVLEISAVIMASIGLLAWGVVHLYDGVNSYREKGY